MHAVDDQPVCLLCWCVGVYLSQLVTHLISLKMLWRFRFLFFFVCVCVWICQILFITMTCIWVAVFKTTKHCSSNCKWNLHKEWTRSENVKQEQGLMCLLYARTFNRKNVIKLIRMRNSAPLLFLFISISFRCTFVIILIYNHYVVILSCLIVRCIQTVLALPENHRLRDVRIPYISVPMDQSWVTCVALLNKACDVCQNTFCCVLYSKKV